MKLWNGKSAISLMLGLLLSMPLPQSAWAAHAQNSGLSLATTEQALAEVSQSDAKKEVNSFFEKDEVRKMLHERGVSDAEINQRIASLSDHELQSLSSQIHQARAGGDILLTVLLIVLIIFFAKRI